MTYCLAINVDAGLVFAADSRTNAGADQISTHSKMHRFGSDGERTFVLLSAGNLATVQGVVSAIERDIDRAEAGNLMDVPDMQAAAEYIGQVSVEEQKKHRFTRRDDEEFVPEATFILGGQIRGEEPGIELIYPEGNFVRSSDSTPYLQIGEVKYGKPVLDRIVEREMRLEAALKCALVSMDSTMRSNATVGPPVEYLTYRKDSFGAGSHHSLGVDDPYLLNVRRAWADNIRIAFENMPEPPSELTLSSASAVSSAQAARIKGQVARLP